MKPFGIRSAVILAALVAGACAAPRAVVNRPGPSFRCEPAEGTGGPFDRGAAAANTRVDLSRCRRPDSEPADGRVEMLFCPGDGAVHAASVVENPFDDETRKCIEQRFLSVRVPPFGGAAVKVKRAVHLR